MWLIGRVAGWSLGWSVGWLVDWMVVRLSGWLVGCLIGWLLGCVVDLFGSLCCGLVSFIHKHEVAELFDAFKSKACLKKEWTETENVEYQQINNIEEILWRVSTSANIGLVPGHLVSGQLDKSLYCFHADDDCNSSMFAVYRDEKKRDEFLNELVSELKSHVQ